MTASAKRYSLIGVDGRLRSPQDFDPVRHAFPRLAAPGRSEVPGEVRVPVEPFAGDELLDTIAP